MAANTEDRAWRRDGPDLLLTLHIQPNARQEGFDGFHDGAIKLRIKAPPVDGKANSRLLKVLAGLFGVSKSAVRLVRGEHSRRKTVRIERPQKLPPWIER